MKKSFFKTVTLPTIIFGAILLLLGASSCKNLVPYTDHLQAERKWTKRQLTGTQFYLSADITLKRELSKEFPDQIVGKIIMENGVKKEVILLP